MQTEIITSLAEAVQLTSEWRKVAGSHPFHSPEWNLTWFEHFGRGAELCLIIDRDNRGALQGLAPLVWNQSSMLGRLQFLGNSLACTDYTSFFAKDDSAAIIQRLVLGADRYLQQQRRRQIGFSSGRLELDGLLVGSPSVEAMVRAFDELRYTVRRRPIEAAYSLQLPETVEQLKAGFPRSIKRKLTRISKSLESNELKFERSGDVRQFDHLLSELVRLHQARRKMLGQPGVFATQSFIDFIKAVATKLARRAQAEFQWCTLNGTVVAMHLAFIHDQTISTYINGLDPNYMDAEPGFTLVGCSLTDAIERGMQCYDFLRGDEPYKQLWQAQARPLERISLTPHAVVPLLYDSAYAIAGNMKRLSQSFVSSQR
jgi:CelD/BcsL family acetyltransferase involved in cellulose biosynthesis